MRDTPVRRLLEIGNADLRRNQAEFKKVAAQIDPNHTAQEILDEAQKDHPSASKLLETFKDVLSGLRDFIEKHKIVTIPSCRPPSTRRYSALSENSWKGRIGGYSERRGFVVNAG